MRHDDSEPIDCIQAGPSCSGPVEYRPASAAAPSAPRCTAHYSDLVLGELLLDGDYWPAPGQPIPW